jgi:hypothetical protein
MLGGRGRVLGPRVGPEGSGCVSSVKRVLGAHVASQLVLGGWGQEARKVMDQ